MTMRWPIFWTLIVLIMGLAAIAAYVANNSTTSSDLAANGPFRDGVYLGAFDAKYDRTPHIAAGRWSRDLDRQSFVTGYETAYERTKRILIQNDGLVRDAVASYRDGLYLGKLAADERRPEQIVTGHWSQPQNKELFALGYHQAYLSEMAQLNTARQTTRASLVH